MPLDDAPKAVALKVNVATAVPGTVTEEGDVRNTNFPAPLAFSNAVTASVAAFRAAVE
jgi:hypothetical protein